MAEKTIEVKLKKLHPRQQEIYDHPAKRKVVVCGRRVGKTTMAAFVAIINMLKGVRVLYCAPTDNQTEAFWDEVKAALGPLIDEKAVYKNETKRLITLKQHNSGRIRAKTGGNADALRGDHGGLIIMDEYAIMDPDVWDKIISPMTLDSDADIYFLFTPLRKNHAYKLYLKAKYDDTGRWAAWNFSSHDNPHLNAEALAELAADMTEDGYRQEIMAEFLDNAGQVFGNLDAVLTSDGECNNIKHTRIAGIDWGKLGDYSSVSIGCLECRKELKLSRWRRMEYRVQREHMKAIFDKYNVYHSFAESNSIGEVNIEQLRADGFAVKGIFTSAANLTSLQAKKEPPRNKSAVSVPKNRLVDNIVLEFQKETFLFLPDEIGRDELESYEVKYSMRGLPSYSHPDGGHDDTVDSRMFMLYGVNSYRPAVY